MSQSDELDKILEQLQYGTIMSDNQEPQLTNNRNIAKQAIIQYYAKLMLEAIIDELEKTMPHTDGMRHYNTVNARLKTLKDELAKLKLIGEKI